jgi:cytidylate kinase
MHRPRSLEEMIEEQARRWQLGIPPPGEEARGPVIAVSRQHGAGGREVAREVARALGLRFYDREILTRIADEAHRDLRRVTAFDETDKSTWLSEWLLSLMAQGYLSPHEFGHRLTRVVCDIAKAGSAVILGRGASLILRPEQALRVHVVAPLEHRMARIAAREGLSAADARRRALEVDAEREAFLHRHFRVATAVPTPVAVDLTVNTETLGVSGATLVVVRAADARFKRLAEPAVHAGG